METTESIIAKAGRVFDKVTQDLDYPIHGKMGRLELIVIVRREIKERVESGKEDRSDMIGKLCSWDEVLERAYKAYKTAPSYC